MVLKLRYSKKALKWLTEHNIEHKLYDYRVDGLDTQFLQQAEAQFGWENLVNKRSTTWRNLDENVKIHSQNPPYFRY